MPAPCRLTVKLTGRAEAPDSAEGAQFLSARGAKPKAHYGPLQRLLDDRRARCLSECKSKTLPSAAATRPTMAHVNEGPEPARNPRNRGSAARAPGPALE